MICFFLFSFLVTTHGLESDTVNGAVSPVLPIQQPIIVQAPPGVAAPPTAVLIQQLPAAPSQPTVALPQANVASQVPPSVVSPVVVATPIAVAALQQTSVSSGAAAGPQAFVVLAAQPQAQAVAKPLQQALQQQALPQVPPPQSIVRTVLPANMSPPAQAVAKPLQQALPQQALPQVPPPQSIVQTVLPASMSPPAQPTLGANAASSTSNTAAKAAASAASEATNAANAAAAAATTAAKAAASASTAANAAASVNLAAPVQATAAAADAAKAAVAAAKTAVTAAANANMAASMAANANSAATNAASVAATASGGVTPVATGAIEPDPEWFLPHAWSLFKGLTFAMFVKGLCVAGNVLVQVSPIPSVRRWDVRGCTGEADAAPYVSIAFGGVQWCFYGILAWLITARTGFLVLVHSNCLGAVLGTYYVSCFFRNCRNEEALRSLHKYLSAVTALALLQFCALSVLPAERALFLIGIISSFCSFINATAVLATVPQVIRTKDSRSIPGPYAIANLLSSAVWSLCGFILSDPCVMMPNIFSTLCAAISLAIKVVYPSTEEERETCLEEGKGDIVIKKTSLKTINEKSVAKELTALTKMSGFKTAGGTFQDQSDIAPETFSKAMAEEPPAICGDGTGGTF